MAAVWLVTGATMIGKTVVGIAIAGVAVRHPRCSEHLMVRSIFPIVLLLGLLAQRLCGRGSQDMVGIWTGTGTALDASEYENLSSDHLYGAKVIF